MYTILAVGELGNVPTRLIAVASSQIELSWLYTSQLGFIEHIDAHRTDFKLKLRKSKSYHFFILSLPCPCAPRLVVLMLEKELVSTVIFSYFVGTLVVDCV